MSVFRRVSGTLRSVSNSRRFGITFRFHLQGSSSWPENVGNYQSVLRNIPEEWRSHKQALRVYALTSMYDVTDAKIISYHFNLCFLVTQSAVNSWHNTDFNTLWPADNIKSLRNIYFWLLRRRSPATGRGGPRGSGWVKAPDFLDVRYYEGGRSSALRTGRLYPRRNTWY
jgi:hypothetical protein